MKKRIFVVCLLLILLCSACSKKGSDFSDDVNSYRDTILTSIISQSDDKVVIKYQNNNDEDCYYVFNISNGSYVQYLYTFHNDEDSYNSFIDSHSDTVYSLVEYKDGYVTKIILNKKNNYIEGNIKEYILNKYNSDKYEIIVK